MLQYVQMSKLTLSVDDGVVSRAKRYAKQQGVSVSQMVETYLAAVAGPDFRTSKDTPPVLRTLRGSLKKADLESYRKHLAAKYK
jgi:antitoxin component of RelBE/YafQ-DinJ toxin-antitoxin module